MLQITISTVHSDRNKSQLFLGLKVLLLSIRSEQHSTKKVNSKETRQAAEIESQTDIDNTRPHSHITMTETGHRRCAKYIRQMCCQGAIPSEWSLFQSAHAHNDSHQTHRSKPVQQPSTEFWPYINGASAVLESRLQDGWKSIGMLATARFHSTLTLLWSRKLPEALPHIGFGNMSELRWRVGDDPNL